MKTISALLTVFLLTIHSTAYSQDMTYSGENIPLKTIFSAIQKQTGYGFFYDRNVLKAAKPVTIKVRNLSVSDVLEEVFKNQPLDYSIENKTILVSKKKIINNAVKAVPKNVTPNYENPDSNQLSPAKSSAINSLKAEILQSKMKGLNNKEFDSSALSSAQVPISTISLINSMSGNLQAQVKSQSEQQIFKFLKSLGEHRKAFYAEGSFLSTTQLTGNFDMRLKPNRNDGLGVRAGLGTDMYNIIMPLSLNYLVGEKRSSFEAGIGFAPTLGLLSYRSVTLNAGFLNLGYRYQPANEGLMFRATWTKFTSLLTNESTYDPMISFSVGYSFHKLGGGSQKIKAGPAVAFNGRNKYVFAEAAGNGLGISANYEVRLKPGRNDGLGIRAGLGIAGDHLTIPLAANYILGKNRSGFEIAVGLTPAIRYTDSGWGIFEEAESAVDAAGLFTLGYRLQSYNGFMFRFNTSVLVIENISMIPFPGISIGYRLNKHK